MEIEQNNSRVQILLPERSQSPRKWIIDQVTILAEAFSQPLTVERLRIYAADLADLGQAQLEVAFTRARRELTFFPKIAELRSLAGASHSQNEDAEARKAWDVLVAFVRKYVGNDVFGNYGPEHGSYSMFPRLSDRILDTVRRTAGWEAYAKMTSADFPFVHKRFVEEYLAWTVVEKITGTSHFLSMPEAKQLVAARSMDLVMPQKPRPCPSGNRNT